MTVEELLSACADDAGEALEAGSVLLDDSPPPAVKAVYRELVRVLQPDRLAMAVLEAIVWVWDGIALRDVGDLAQALCDVPGEDFRILAATDKLEKLGIIKLEKHGIIECRVPGDLVGHREPGRVDCSC